MYEYLAFKNKYGDLFPDEKTLEAVRTLVNAELSAGSVQDERTEVKDKLDEIDSAVDTINYDLCEIRNSVKRIDEDDCDRSAVKSDIKEYLLDLEASVDDISEAAKNAMYILKPDPKY